MGKARFDGRKDRSGEGKFVGTTEGVSVGIVQSITAAAQNTTKGMGRKKKRLAPVGSSVGRKLGAPLGLSVGKLDPGWVLG